MKNCNYIDNDYICHKKTMLKFSQGDSISIGLIIPENRLSYIQDIVVSVGSKVVAKKSNGTLIDNDGHFLIKLSSKFTSLLSGPYSVIVTIDYSDQGIIKTKANESLQLQVIKSINSFQNDSVNNATIAATITIVETDLGISQNIELATFYRGFSALDVFRMEHNMPNASNDDMLQFSFMRERRNFFVGNINYIGVAKLGSSDEQEVWKITKIEIAENGGTLVKRANNVAWNNKLTINYN